MAHPALRALRAPLRSIRDQPGQPELRVGDLLLEVNGQSLQLDSEAELPKGTWLPNVEVCVCVVFLNETMVFAVFSELCSAKTTSQGEPLLETVFF